VGQVANQEEQGCTGRCNVLSNTWQQLAFERFLATIEASSIKKCVSREVLHSVSATTKHKFKLEFKFVSCTDTTVFSTYFAVFQSSFFYPNKHTLVALINQQSDISNSTRAEHYGLYLASTR
jgi:hypothetical protein